jgi:hypothetical protein
MKNEKKKGGGKQVLKSAGELRKMFHQKSRPRQMASFLCLLGTNEFLFSPESKLSSLLCWLAG